jgi:diketogulonate reductase-like aldo/keto reductase
MATRDTLRYTGIPIRNGSGTLPALGFGTLLADPSLTGQALKTALQVGFRHVDCAERYRNEDAVGEALKEAFTQGIAQRAAVYVTAKLWNNNHRPERVKPAFEASLKRLQLDYVDCYLIHTPFAFRPGPDQDPRDERGEVVYDTGVTLAETWQALEELKDEGRCRAIGLSNVDLGQVKDIFESARIKPDAIEVESHPYLPQWELLSFCREHQIAFMAYAALGHGMAPRVIEDPTIVSIAQRVGKTPAQVILAWAVQRGTAVLTSSTNSKFIEQNADIATLPEDAMSEIRDRLTTRTRFNAVVATGVPGMIPQRM